MHVELQSLLAWYQQCLTLCEPLGSRLCVLAFQGVQLAVLAHSMGNQALTQALQGTHLSEPGHHFMFAAPDIAVADFQERLQRCQGSWQLNCAHDYTLYCANRDTALWLSKLLRFFREPRAGDCSIDMCMAEAGEFVTIDCSPVGNSAEDRIFHSYVFRNPDVAADIARVAEGDTADTRKADELKTLQPWRAERHNKVVEELHIYPRREQERQTWWQQWKERRQQRQGPSLMQHEQDNRRTTAAAAPSAAAPPSAAAAAPGQQQLLQQQQQVQQQHKEPQKEHWWY